METNIAPGLRFSILDREFKKKLEERANRMGLTAVQLRVLGELSRAESMGACEINQKDLEKALAVTHPTMTEIIKRLEKKKAVITFDDGWMDAYMNAYPFLKRYNIPFTVYITTNFIGKEGYIGNSELKVYSEDPLVTIGFHTQSHSKLRYENNMQKEIFLSRKELEKKVGKAILFFAYPYGKLYTIGLRSIFFTQKTDYKNAVGTIDTSLTCFSMLFRYYLPRKVIY